MAILTTSDAVAIMAEPSIRAANDATTAILVLSGDLARLVWANSAAARSFGLTAGLQDGDAAPQEILRQVRSSAGVFSRTGRTTLLLRAAKGLGAGATPSELRRESFPLLGENAESFAVLTVPLARPARAPDTQDAALLAEAGGGTLGLFQPDGEAILAPDAAGSPVPAEAVATFAQGDRDITEIAGHDGLRVVLARVGDNRILAWSDGSHLAPSEPADEPQAEFGPEHSEDGQQSDAVDESTQETPEDVSPAAELAPSRRRPLRSTWHAPSPQSVDTHADAAPPEQGDAYEEIREASAANSGDTDDAPAGEEPDQFPAPDFANTPQETGPEDAAGSEDVPASSAAPRIHSAWGAPPIAPSAEFLQPEDQASTPAETASVEAREPDDEPVEDGGAGVQPTTVEEPAMSPVRQVTVDDFGSVDAGRTSWDGPVGSFIPATDREPVRFVWRIDSEGRFRSLSPEFADAVGPASADVIDRSFEDVARAYGLDPDGAIGKLLARRDTWSGRTVLWPLENSDKKVPVDLAALPIYARDRSFDGFRGFGVVRLADAMADAEAIGLHLPEAFERLSAADLVAETRSEASAEDVASLMRTISADRPRPPSFGRRDPADRPAEPETPPAEDDVSADGGKVIHLEERRRPRDAALSQTEEAAFRAIGETLARGGDPNDLVEAVRAASERIDEIEWKRFSDGPDAEPASDRSSEEVEEKGAPLPVPTSEVGPATEDASEEASAPEARARLIAELDRVYGAIPMPILVQAGDALIYGNREFFDLTGYEELDKLVAAGGLDHLIQDRAEDDESGLLRIERANGRIVSVRARMQRQSAVGASYLLIAFFASPRLCALCADMLDAAERPQMPDAGPEETLPAATDELESAIIDLAADAVVLFDDEGTIAAMSGTAHSLFGIEPGDEDGRPFLSLFAHESQKGLKTALKSASEEDDAPEPVAGAPLVDREVIGRGAGGAFLTLSVSIGRLPGREGWCAVIRDIRRWKEDQDQLERARANAEASSLQKSTFLSEVTEDIRSPVETIIGFADVIASETHGPLGNERYLEYLGDIKRSGYQVLDLVKILHDLGRVESGRLQLAFEAVSLSEIVSEVVQVISPQANRQRVIVRTHLPSSVPPIVGDRDTIRQIATNLIADSIRSTPAGGQLIVSTKFDPNSGVSLRFRDSGVGMREEEIEAVLHTPGSADSAPGGAPHHRTASSESGRLGLPLTKALVEANRAELSISSTPGEGTLVEVRFALSRVLAD
ncbi:ATP-binding protein [Jiella marina]|uniref:ATP-binding protein n=1 Tax=Jiella sp. LLJ827 TaxID=2917712 RepID=UPI002100AAE1|nr:ATP-binding protein [Jiella sp. LLJ827]MCQ0987853.1 ATP-binding protein [Jiella sp. LLJ827]